MGITSAASGPRLLEAASIDDFNSLAESLEFLTNFGYPLNYWVSGNDLYEENVWKWLSGTAVPSAAFFTGSPVPADKHFNCMYLLYDVYYLALAQNCGASS